MRVLLFFLQELDDYLNIPHYALYFISNLDCVIVLFRALGFALPAHVVQVSGGAELRAHTLYILIRLCESAESVYLTVMPYLLKHLLLTCLFFFFFNRRASKALPLTGSRHGLRSL